MNSSNGCANTRNNSPTNLFRYHRFGEGFGSSRSESSSGRVAPTGYMIDSVTNVSTTIGSAAGCIHSPTRCDATQKWSAVATTTANQSSGSKLRQQAKNL